MGREELALQFDYFSLVLVSLTKHVFSLSFTFSFEVFSSVGLQKK